MTSKFATRWINYLEGKRKATGAMGRGNGGRCCLGHVAQMYANETKTPIKWRNAPAAGLGGLVDVIREFTIDNGDSWWGEGQLPEEIMDWTELNYSEVSNLSEENDSAPGFPIVMINNIGQGLGS